MSIYHDKLKLNFIGSKRSLCALFKPVLEQYVSEKSEFYDLFCGTGYVSYYVKQNFKPRKIIANDINYFSALITKALLTDLTQQDIQRLNEHITQLNLQEDEGFFYHNYADTYFSTQNCRLIDGMRQYIQKQGDNYLLLALLICSADAVANTASVYDAYLKNIKKSANNKLQLPKLAFNPQTEINCNLFEVYQDDIFNFKDLNIDILYLDPPYNSRQYSSNYHILETLALYDDPELNGKTKKRNYYKSPFCYKTASKYLFDIIEEFKYRVLMISYNNEGIIKIEDIIQVLIKQGRVSVYSLEYKKFNSNAKNKNSNVIEFLLVCERDKPQVIKRYTYDGYKFI